MRARHFAISAVLVVLPVATACGNGQTSALNPVAAPDNARHVQVDGPFTAAPGPAVTYDQKIVPLGASATVTADEAAASTTVTLKVTGLLPNRAYGAHAHAKPCGPEGKDAGPHYQFSADPVSPSVDPAYANPKNEIWLDLKTDAAGAGSANTTVSWAFPADRRAGSVVIHALPTATEAGKAGTAGDRAACLTVAF